MVSEIEMLREIEQAEIVGKEIEADYPDTPDFAKMYDLNDFAPSAEVQAAEIRDVFYEMSELRFENWEKMSVAERTEALNRFEQKIAEIEMRPPMPVLVEPMKDGLMGYYDGHSLRISETLLGSDIYENYKESFDTLFHEGRHAYQFYNLYEHRTEQSDNLVNSWRANLDILGYDRADVFALTDVGKQRGYYRYFTQPIEVDARQFAEDAMKKIGF